MLDPFFREQYWPIGSVNDFDARHGLADHSIGPRTSLDRTLRNNILVLRIFVRTNLAALKIRHGGEIWEPNSELSGRMICISEPEQPGWRDCEDSADFIPFISSWK